LDQIELCDEELIWTPAKARYVGGSWILDGAIARDWLLRRREAESEGRAILDEFVKLKDAKGEKILAFAKRWGVLDLCQHGVPRQHETLPGLPIKVPSPLGLASDSVPSRCPAVRHEPLETWRFFARQAAALLRIAAQVRQERLASQRDWALVLNEGWSPQPRVQDHRGCLRDVLDSWLTIGKVGVAIDDRSETLKWRGADLFGELAVQLALVSLGKEGRVFCSKCGKEYVPKKRVAKGAVHVCPAAECQRQANAERQRRARERKKDPDRPIANARRLRYRAPYGGLTDDPFFS
jgi:hypothetical protein